MLVLQIIIITLSTMTCMPHKLFDQASVGITKIKLKPNMVLIL